MHSSVRTFRWHYGGIQSQRPTLHMSPVQFVIAWGMHLPVHHIFLLQEESSFATVGPELVKERAIFILEHLQLLMDLELTMVKRNKRYFPVLLLALAQAKCYKTASDVTVLYIVPAGTNHHLRRKQGGIRTFINKRPKRSLSQWASFTNSLYKFVPCRFFICSACDWHTTSKHYYKAINFSRQQKGAVGCSRARTAPAFKLG